jgi:hypothetical protein
VLGGCFVFEVLPYAHHSMHYLFPISASSCAPASCAWTSKSASKPRGRGARRRVWRASARGTGFLCVCPCVWAPSSAAHAFHLSVWHVESSMQWLRHWLNDGQSVGGGRERNKTERSKKKKNDGALRGRCSPASCPCARSSRMPCRQMAWRLLRTAPFFLHPRPFCGGGGDDVCGA